MALSKNTVTLVTSDDYWLTPHVARRLESRGYKVEILDVQLPGKGDLEKKIKLAFLFGPAAIIKIIATSYTNRRGLQETNRVKTMSFEDAIAHVSQCGGPIMLMNFPQKFPVLDRQILNFHPALLPSYRGLMSFPRMALDRLSGEKPNVGVTVHEIAETFDTGPVLWQKKLEASILDLPMKDLYELSYGLSADGLDDIMSGNAAPHDSTKIIASYSKVLSKYEILKFLFYRSKSLLLNVKNT